MITREPEDILKGIYVEAERGQFSTEFFLVINGSRVARLFDAVAAGVLLHELADSHTAHQLLHDHVHTFMETPHGDHKQREERFMKLLGALVNSCSILGRPELPKVTPPPLQVTTLKFNPNTLKH